MLPAMNVTHWPARASNHQGVRMRGIWLVALAVLLLTSAPSASAQNKRKGEETTRSVKGLVTSGDDQPVPGARVMLKNTKTLQIRSFFAKEDGTYFFTGLSPDVDYELTAEAGGASSGAKPLSSFDSRKEAIINLKLNPKK